jgi:hypothetical protein
MDPAQRHLQVKISEAWLFLEVVVFIGESVDEELDSLRTD